MEILQKYKSRIFIFSFLLALGAVIWACFACSKLPKYGYSIEDWVSENAVYENNGLSVSEKIKNTRKNTTFLWGPYKYLQKGSYTVHIKYSADEDQVCLATAAGGMAQLFDSSEGILSHHLHNTDYQFEINDNLDEFQLVFYYNGTGNFTINSISIVANNRRIKRLTAEVIFVSIFLALSAAVSSCNKKHLLTAAALFSITLFVSLPLAMKGIPNGDDLGVHYLRIESIVQAIRSRQFPARISGVTLYGLGYPFSIFYNDIFLYFPAVLRLLGFSVNTAYKIYVFSINLLTAAISWYSFKEIFRNGKLSILLTLLYSASSYRMLNIWTRGAVGEYTAQCFLPLLALALYKIYTDRSDSFRSLFSNSVLLAAAMTGIIGAHLLTTLMACFLILLVCFYFLRKTFQLRTILSYLMGVLITIVINLYFLVPFIDYYLNEPIYIKSLIQKHSMLIQQYGAYPLQFFNFFQSTAVEHFFPIENRLQCTPGLPLMVILCFGIILWLFHKRSRLFTFSLFSSLFLLFLASDIFPWNWLTLHFPFWSSLASIQFPWRFMSFAVLSLVILSGTILEKNIYRSRTVMFLTVSTVIMSVWFIGDMLDQGEIIYIYDTSGVKPTWTGTEYLLDGSQRENIIADVQSENMQTAEFLSRNANTLKIYCRSGNNSAEHIVIVPIYNYKGYIVSDEFGTEYEIRNGDQNRIMFALPDNFDGVITISFKDPAFWTAALSCSALCSLVLILWFFLRKKRNLTI